MTIAAVNVYWFALPLVAAVSLVYAASRHEQWSRIWAHALRLCGMIVGILLAATAILLLLNSQV
ncbi:MAG TPA: hypothetical protein VF590_25335 [Isosphaeraceae bacterium]